MLQASGDSNPTASEKQTVPAYSNKNISEDDEEAAAGIDSEDFAIQDYIPGQRHCNYLRSFRGNFNGVEHCVVPYYESQSLSYVYFFYQMTIYSYSAYHPKPVL